MAAICRQIYCFGRLENRRIEPAEFLSSSLPSPVPAYLNLKRQYAENKDGRFSNLQQILTIFIRMIKFYWSLLIESQI